MWHRGAYVLSAARCAGCGGTQALREVASSDATAAAAVADEDGSGCARRVSELRAVRKRCMVAADREWRVCSQGIDKMRMCGVAVDTDDGSRANSGQRSAVSGQWASG